MVDARPLEQSSESLDWESLNRRRQTAVLEKLKVVPGDPGCYLMKNSAGQAIYVGKAKILRSRVRQYFQKGADLSRRIRRMVHEVADIEWIVTDTELEALILESNLIKKHKPYYNVRLRDDKSYPYIAVTLSEPWPRPVFMRKLRMTPAEADRYYGPYTDSLAVRDTLKLIRQLFKIPCGYKSPDQSKGRACMYYHIGQCTGICAGVADRQEYLSAVNDAMAFLDGRRDELVAKLEREMESAAENLSFEKAARIRDQVLSIRKLIAGQKVVCTDCQDQDVIAVVTDRENTCVEVFFVRSGKLIGQDHFLLENAWEDDIEESLEAFMLHYYKTAPHVPRQVLTSAEIGDASTIENWLRSKRGSKVELITPKRGQRKKLVDMAAKNAQGFLAQLRVKLQSDQRRVEQELRELQHAAGLPNLPCRIECYDISNTQGSDTVASLVVFENGQPKKSDYRKFKIRRSDGEPDDYASLGEAITRRLTGTSRRSKAMADLPDLFLIDGGKGQLNAALEALRTAGESVPTISIAKRNEEIYVPGRTEPVILPRSSPALRLVQRIRDETHRFAITFHRQLRGKSVRTSILSTIPGIGPKRRKQLLKSLQSIERIKNASVEELAAAPGMTRTTAQAVFDFFRSREQE